MRRRAADNSMDCYAVLAIAPSATDAEIDRAFRLLAKRLHPDVNKAPDAAAQFARIVAAHDIIGDPTRRAAYDRTFLAATAPLPPPPPTTSSARFTPPPPRTVWIDEAEDASGARRMRPTRVMLWMLASAFVAIIAFEVWAPRGAHVAEPGYRRAAASQFIDGDGRSWVRFTVDGELVTTRDPTPVYTGGRAEIEYLKTDPEVVKPAGRLGPVGALLQQSLLQRWSLIGGIAALIAMIIATSGPMFSGPMFSGPVRGTRGMDWD